MSTTTSTLDQLNRRDRAVLAAVAAGRGVVVAGRLLIDGLPCADQFVAARMRAAGLLAAQVAGPARLTDGGTEALAA
jgi:hypothetical protein